MFANYVKIAWRNTFYQKAYSLINIGSLAVAITAVLLIMMWVQNELRFDNYHPAANQIFLVTNQEQTDIHQSTNWEHSPYPLANALARQFPEVELVTQMTRSYQKEINLHVNGRIFTEDYTAYVDDNWFKIFHYDLVEGDLSSFSAHPYSLILTESKAKTLFGLTQAAGQKVRIDSTDYVVRAVVKDNPVNSSFQFDIILPIASKLNTKQRLEEANTWLYTAYRTFVRLRPDAKTARMAGKITRLYANNRDKKNLTASLLPLKDLHFESGFKVSAFSHGDLTTVKIYVLLALLLLLAACINYVNLTVARMNVRFKEIGVRKMVGASQLQLFFQVIAECILISGAALGLAMILVVVNLPAFNRFMDRNFTFQPLELHTVALLLGSWVVTLVLISVYPALLLSAINPLQLFQGMGLLRVKKSSFRQLLTGTQFCLTVVMIVSAIVVYRQFSFMQSQHQAYGRSQLFTVQVPREHINFNSSEQFRAYHERFEARLQSLKQQLQDQTSVRQVARLNMSSVVDNGYTTSGGIDWEGRLPSHQPEYIDYSADNDLNAIMQFQLVAGRWFDPKLSTDQENTVLNETAVKQFALSQPVIGKRFNKGKIIGVVKDFHHQDLHKRIAPVVIQINHANSGSFLIDPQPGQAVTALETVLAGFQRQFPGEPLVYAFMDQEFDRLYRADQKALEFTLWFSGLSILIACMGLLGMMTFATEQRRKEIGVRKVLGASVTSIVALLSTDSLKLIVVSIAVASPVAFFCLNRWLQGFAYRVSIEWWMFVLAGLVALGVALLTVLFQSVKAALTNPVNSLRSD